MTHPTSPVKSSAFDLDAVASELRGEEAYAREGHAARTLIREPDLRSVLMVVRSGCSIKEHRAGETVAIYTLAGHLRLRLPDGIEELPAGRLLVLQRDLPHSVEALADSTFVLTLGRRG